MLQKSTISFPIREGFGVTQILIQNSGIIGIQKTVNRQDFNHCTLSYFRISNLTIFCQFFQIQTVHSPSLFIKSISLSKQISFHVLFSSCDHSNEWPWSEWVFNSVSIINLFEFMRIPPIVHQNGVLVFQIVILFYNDWQYLISSLVLMFGLRYIGWESVFWSSSENYSSIFPLFIIVYPWRSLVVFVCHVVDGLLESF